MVLSFSTKWPDRMGGGPTHFVEKIWAGLIHEIDGIGISDYEKYTSDYRGRFRKEISDYNQMYIHPKIQTIRYDPHDRWKVGMKIHPVINNRTPQRFQFAPTLVCTTVQKIEIKHHVGHSQLDIDGECYGEIFHHGLDDIYEFTNDLVVLSHNDGFDSIEHFFQWFNEPFVGKLIHWMDSKY